MAVLKCKMCGAALTVGDNDKFAQCRYCDSMQTLPNLDNELKIKLFERATELRLACDFDQAAGVFQSIIAQFPEEAEAYWGLVLCKYGIEYVDDPKDGKKVPTCHRTRYQSVLNDADYGKVCELAAVSSWKYEEEAQVIEDLQQKILSISRAEEPYDVFICYKETDDATRTRTDDSATAQDIYTELIAKGYKVFFSRVTLRGKAGSEYEPYIYAALSSAKVMLVIGSKQDYFNAVWLKNEWSRYLEMMKDSDKILIPCYESITPEQLPRQLQSFQALNIRSITFLSDLFANIARVVGKAPAVKPTVVETRAADNNHKELNFDDGAYVGEAIGDRPHGYGTWYYKNGDRYEGKWNLGVKQGQGTFTYASSETWTGEWKDDKQENGNGTIWIVRDGELTGNRYEGALVNGNRHGYGTYFYANGDRYEGAFKDGKPNGQGTYTYASGETWTGEWKDGARFAGNGFVLFFKDGKPTGERYNGEIANGNYNGKGSITYENGDRYEGAFVNGKRHGYGTYTFKNGDRYEGNYIDGLANGQGTYTYASGESWTGELKNNTRYTGKGVTLFLEDGKPTGARHEGYTENGRYKGQGVYVYANGDRYEGEFADNTCCGQGTYTYVSGETWTGEWKDNKRVNGSGTVLYFQNGKPTGKRYDGEIANGVYQGKGVLIGDDGDRYEGEFANDKFNGQGTYIYADGKTWTGKWKEGLRFTGKGYVKYFVDNKPSGNRYDGEMHDGEFNGQGVFYRKEGDRYEGEFRNGAVYKGCLIDKNGKVQDTFVKGKSKRQRRPVIVSAILDSLKGL